MKEDTPYNFDGKISREVLERYLSRAITQMALTDSPQRAEDVRMLKNVGAKFIGRAACMWLTPEDPDDAADFRKCRETADLVHKADPDVILEACIFEAVSAGVNKIPVPDWVCEAFGLAPERRAFNYDAMLYDGGTYRNHWGQGGSVPDMSKLETRMWFFYRAASYIDAGFEGLHFGQVHLMNQKDPGNRHWIDVLTRVRAYAGKHARRHLALCNSHTHGIVEDGKLLFDFHCWPVRPKEVDGKPMEAVLEAGHGDAIFGKSKGGITPSGWACEHLPYIVEVDNWASSGKGGQSVGFCWVWGYDEICWFARQSPEYRNQWLRYAWQWVREHDTNGWLEMPGRRCLADPIAGVAIYQANTRSKTAPLGFGQEDTIKVVWAEENKRAATETNDNQLKSTDVGIWYCTYYGDDWTNVGDMGYAPVSYRPLFSSKPGDYRTYNATNVAVVDFHLQQIAAAQIDFLLFELTPGGLGGYRRSTQVFVDNARVVAKRIKSWNDTHSWKIRYAIAAGAHRDVYGNDPIGLCMEREAQDVYDHFYNNPDYGGSTNYYQLDGKPLIVYWGDRNQNTAAWNSYSGDKTYGNRFAVRYAQDVVRGNYGWNIYSNGTVLDGEVEVVSPGWGHYKRATPPYVSRQKGDFYAQCWNTVLTNPRPRIVMIVAFNDYLENTAVWTADTTQLTDADKWIGPDGKDQPSLYWDLTIRNIRALRSGATADASKKGAGRDTHER